MIYLNGLGCVGSFGSGINAFQQALADPGKYTALHHVAEYNLDTQVHLAGTSQLSDYIPKAKQRRMDHFSRMFYLAGMNAIAQSSLEEESLYQHKIGVICATAYGAAQSSYSFKDSLNTKADHFASPLHFSKSVSNSAIANFMLNLQLHGPNLTICQPKNALESAIEVAHLWLDQQCDTVIVIGLDEFTAPLAYSAQRLQETGLEECICPATETLGEGCSAFIFTNEKDEKDRLKEWSTNSIAEAQKLASPFGTFPTNIGFKLLVKLLSSP